MIKKAGVEFHQHFLCFWKSTMDIVGIDMKIRSVSCITVYGSTTVVMATHGLHWKWLSLTPCQSRPSEPIEKIFDRIDYVIDLNNLAKFGFRKIFTDGGTHTQHIRVRPSFSFFSFFSFIFFNFLKFHLWWRCSQTAKPILTRNTSFDAVWWESDPFLEMKNIGWWPWPWKGQNPPFCLTLKILTRIFSK